VRRRSGGLGLNIWGGTRTSTTGIFNTLPITVKAESAPYTPHKTNWDYTLSSPSTIDVTSATGMLIYGINDYSSNKYDYYYGTNRGKTPYIYDFEIDWYINDVDTADDIAAVATREWTSTEKYTYELTNTNLTIDTIVNASVSCTDIGSEVNCNQLMYTYEAAATPSPGGATGTITITYTDECGITKTTQSPFSGSNPIDLQVCSSSTPSASYSGTGSVSITNFAPLLPAQGCSPEEPSTGCDSSKYGLSSNFGKVRKCCSNTFSEYYSVNLTTTMNIKLFNNQLQNPNFLRPARANYAPSPVGSFAVTPEYPDYSDIFIEVRYQSADISGTNIAETQVYSYGGILTRDEYIAKAKLISPKPPSGKKGDDSVDNTPKPFSDDDNFKWYIVTRENTGEYLFVTLSTYMRPASVLTASDIQTSYSATSLVPPTFKKLYNTVDNGTALINSENGTFLVTNNTISLQSNIKIVKVANFPSCGKVDIYTKKTGGITGYNNNTITSAGHGLYNGEVIKFSSAISATGVTSLNGIKYVSGVTTDTFNIYYDAKFQTAANIENLKTISGVNWTSNGWKYNHTLYSPLGKNGYGFSPKVRTAVEVSGVEGSIYTRAIESDKTEDGLTRPQAYLNSWTSWNNFFPFKRVSESNNSSPVIYEEYGGNRFGADCQISQVSDNNYILMITEPGTELSFELYNKFYSEDYIPANKFVIPHYLPYGRIHFYNITKSPYDISYITSVSQTGNPWAAYEAANLSSKREGYNFITNNYDLTVDNSGTRNVLSNNLYNSNVNNYWLGARYYAWNKEYGLNNTLGIDMPLQDKYPREYGFLDSFGVSAAFNIESGNLYCVGSTYVKSADFIMNNRVKNVDALSLAFNIDLNTNEVSSLSGIIVPSNMVSSDTQVQINELGFYAENTDFDNKKLFIGWMSKNTNGGSIYIYDRIGSGYNLNQKIDSPNINKNFGNYFVADNGFLITDAYSITDDSNQTTDPLNYLYIYKKDILDGPYTLLQRISPTIDLDNAIYADINASYYTLTNNLSYDNTTGNSATLKSNLGGKYDIFSNSLILRDYNEYAYYTFDAASGIFICRNHHLITDNNLLTQLAVLRMRPSQASFIEANPTAELIESLEVFEGSEDLKAIKIINQSYPNPTYLPLFIKSNDGANNSIPIYALGGVPVNTGLYLYTEAEAVHNSGINLFCKQIETHNSGINLFIKQPDVYKSGLPIVIQQLTTTNSLTLVMPQQVYGSMPLVVATNDIALVDQAGNVIEIPSGQIGNYIKPYVRPVTLYIENYYTGVPNSSGSTLLYIQTYEYDDFAGRMNMVMATDPPPSSYNNNINLFLSNPSGSTLNSSGNYNYNNLFLQGPQFENGPTQQGGMNLVLFKTPEAQLPLFVYNTTVLSNLDMTIKSANLHNSGISLFSSGELYPVENTNLTTLYVRGN